MLKVGLTGGIASGKTTVGAMFRELGAHVVDSDRVTHDLLEPGQEVHDAVVQEFGRAILDANGRIDRKVLGGIVFGDESRRQALNALVHPAIQSRQDQFLEEALEKDPNGVAIVDAALMIETGSYKRYDRIVVVVCPPEMQQRRLGARGLTADQIEARIRSQMPLEEKARFADYLIDNSGDLPATRRQVEEVWSELTSLSAFG